MKKWEKTVPPELCKLDWINSTIMIVIYMPLRRINFVIMIHYYLYIWPWLEVILHYYADEEWDWVPSNWYGRIHSEVTHYVGIYPLSIYLLFGCYTPVDWNCYIQWISPTFMMSTFNIWIIGTCPGSSI